MADEIVPSGILRNECSQLGIFYGYLLNPGPEANDPAKLLARKGTVIVYYGIELRFVNVILNSFNKAVESAFGGIGDVGKDRIFGVVVN